MYKAIYNTCYNILQSDRWVLLTSAYVLIFFGFYVFHWDLEDLCVYLLSYIYIYIEREREIDRYRSIYLSIYINFTRIC